jgi:acyl-CoA dehydrogenase
VLSAGFLSALGDESVNSELLAKIASGTTIVALAVVGRGDAVEARQVNGAWMLSGSIGQVLDGEIADSVIVVAKDRTNTGAYLVAGSDPSLHKTALSGLDLTRRQAKLVLDGVGARKLRGTVAEGALHAEDALRRCLDLAALAVAAEQLGVLRACVDRTVSYVKDRIQFDRPVGSFQAVKHGCAEMWVRYELAEAAVRHAAANAARLIPEDPVATTLALAYCSEAVVETANDMIQYHGGIAYTWEHDAHLYYRRAHSSSVLLGRPAEHRARLGQLLGI